MKIESKAGKQIVDDFFNSLETNSDFNQDVVNLILSLYRSGKLTNNEIDLGLEDIRKKLLNETEEGNS